MITFFTHSIMNVHDRGKLTFTMDNLFEQLVLYMCQRIEKKKNALNSYADVFSVIRAACLEKFGYPNGKYCISEATEIVALCKVIAFHNKLRINFSNQRVWLI
ncbi:unnamed protein product [Adineta ricciae]|uniref:Uncharacterized protein n=1 Tax=Adineta ricciae TaxID=249248 RepID=A0A814IRU7_ADIRI|nr:unnamed protein product [Adineta ricciae]